MLKIHWTDLTRLTQDKNVLFEITKTLNGLKEGYSNTKIDSAFSAINNLLGACGVEAIRLPDTWTPYWEDIAYIYISTGDLDSDTLVCDVKKMEISVACLEELIKIQEGK